MTDTEINEDVARKLGYKLSKVTVTGEVVINRQNDTGFADIDYGRIPDYCHSIGAAWEVVDHLKSIYHGGAAYKLTYDSVDEEWSAWVGSVIGTSATAPMSICLAFLKL